MMFLLSVHNAFYRQTRWLATRLIILLSLGWLSLGLSACDLPQVQATERIFLPLQLELMGDYQLPPQTSDQTPVGGLSGITYDRQRDLFYAISDDRSNLAPARFYTLKLQLKSQGNLNKFTGMQVTNVTRLKNAQGEFYPQGAIDTEGIALTPSGEIFISSEGVQGQADPFINRFDRQTGAWQQSLPLPPYFLASPTPLSPTSTLPPSTLATPTPSTQTLPSPVMPAQGVQNNLGFESLTLSPQGDRLFTATESALRQDLNPTDSGPVYCRILHYLLGEATPLGDTPDNPSPQLISEHVYPLDPKPEGVTVYGLVELLAIDNGGHFLSLERGYSPNRGFYLKLFQVATGSATDIQGMETLKGMRGIQPVRKQLLLDLSTLNIPLDNLEGMTLGPHLADGSQTLLLVSDNNFQLPNSQFLLFQMRPRPTR